MIMHWRPVAVEYLKFWFLIDVISTLPPEAWGSDSSVTAQCPTPFTLIALHPATYTLHPGDCPSARCPPEAWGSDSSVLAPLLPCQAGTR